jgi:hypothetical protein
MLDKRFHCQRYGDFAGQLDNGVSNEGGARLKDY